MAAGTIGVGLVGCGEVGAEVARALLEDHCALASRCGVELELRRVLVRDTAKARGAAIPATSLTTNPADLLDDPRTQIVVELAGGVDFARDVTLAALRAGRDVVTANKALLATCGPEIFAAARAAGRCVAFEASVCGGIPLIESIRRGLAANHIESVLGILNGTCNYILTRMLETGAAYAGVLAEAQKAGYAEADPTLDVSGADSAHKLVILASLALGRACDLSAVATRGITDLALRDLRAGAELGYVCKLLAKASQHDDGVELSVEPTFVPRAHPLAAVAGPFNAVSIYADRVGHVFFYGRGAGGRPTSSAVLADIIDVAVGNAARTFRHLAVLPDQTPKAAYRPPGEGIAPYYLRVGLLDRPGGIGRIATILGNHGISIASIVQHEEPDDGADRVVPVFVTTHPAKDQALRAAQAVIARLDVVHDPPICIPMLRTED